MQLILKGDFELNLQGKINLKHKILPLFLCSSCAVVAVVNCIIKMQVIQEILWPLDMSLHSLAIIHNNI
jgi:hypothetical protein